MNVRLSWWDGLGWLGGDDDEVDVDTVSRVDR